MTHRKDLLETSTLYRLYLAIVTVVAYKVIGAASVVVPSTGCYAFDNSSHIYDFSSWVGKPFEHDGEVVDSVVRFCKDVETRSQNGYVDFGRFNKYNYFAAGSGRYNFVQEYFDGDLTNCEQSFDKMGRTAQVNIICGSCPSKQCKGGHGCICDVTDESTCRVLVELAIPCEKQDVRVFKGFTVGFHPRSWEIVYNGMTQVGYEKAYNEFSFTTEQSSVVLYMTAVASLSNLVRKPTIEVYPEQGLEVRLSGSGVAGTPPTTLSPTMLIVDWRCEKARYSPYEVQFSIPADGYEPIKFTLTKMCEHRQNQHGDATRGWAVFGVLSCIFIVVSTLFCCGGFVYRTRVENQQGLHALPGMTILSACLETVSGGGHSYTQSEEVTNPFSNQASYEHQQASNQGARRSSEIKYGSI